MLHSFVRAGEKRVHGAVESIGGRQWVGIYEKFIPLAKGARRRKLTSAAPVS